MKTSHKKKTVTLGDLIAGGYRLCGKRRTRGIIRLAAKTRLLCFEGAAAV